MENAPAVFQAMINDVLRVPRPVCVLYMYLDDIHGRGFPPMRGLGRSSHKDWSKMGRCTHVQRNYDIGNQELLAVKVALEEWRYWLEGALHPLDEP